MKKNIMLSSSLMTYHTVVKMEKNKTKLFAISLAIALIILGGFYYYSYLEDIRFNPTSEGFIRGDSNSDGNVDIADPVYLLTYLFRGREEYIPDCFDAADANDDGNVDISDPIFMLNFLFLGGPLPPHPFPNPGYDLTIDQYSCGDSNILNSCGFGKASQQCLCKDQDIPNDQNLYCCFDNPQAGPCTNVKVYSQLKTTPGQKSDLWACALGESGEGCNTYNSKVQLTMSSPNQLNPSYAWMSNPSSLDLGFLEKGIVVWEENNNIYWCDLTQNINCDENKVSIGSGFNPSVNSHLDSTYIVWEQEQFSIHYIYACELTKAQEEDYSCYEDSLKILIRVRDLDIEDFKVISNPLIKYNLVLYRDKMIDQINSIIYYDLNLCQLRKSGDFIQCIPVFSTSGQMDLPSPGDITLEGGILYANKVGKNYNIIYENRDETIMVKENTYIVETPQAISLKNKDEELLFYSIWKESYSGSTDRIKIKLIKEDTPEDPPVMYKVNTPGYTEASDLFLVCSDSENTCTVGEKIIGPIEGSNRQDLVDGNFLNNLYTCDITKLANYPDPIVSNCFQSS
jgi:hypothetical protein